VTDCIGSCDSSFIVSSSLDKSIIYWDVSTGVPVRRLRVHFGGVNCVRFNEDSSVAVSGGKDNAVLCWDIRTRNLEPVQRMTEAKDSITSLVVTEHTIISSSLDGCIRQYDIRAGELSTDDIGVPITHLVQTKDSPCVVAAFLDGVIRLVDLDMGDLLQEFKGHKANDYHIECGVLNNDSQVVTGSTEGYAVVYDLMEGKEAARFPIGRDVVHSLCTHPTNSDVIFARRREIQLWGEPSAAEDDDQEFG
jgi:mitogen-activated protein kinase organizer 1